MATESPIRILQGSDKWSAIEQSQYVPSSPNMAIEDVGVFLKGHLQGNAVPSRSGSAPPSMEGSMAAIENIFSKKKSTLYTDYASHVGLDSRFTLPVRSLENYLMSHHNGSTESRHNMILNHGSKQFPIVNLPAHEEEPDDDKASQLSGTFSVENAPLSGTCRGSNDYPQTDIQCSSSDSYDSYCSPSHKPMEETVDSDSRNALSDRSLLVSTADVSAGADDTSLVSGHNPLTNPSSRSPVVNSTRGIVVGSPEICLNNVNSDSKNDQPSTVVTELDVSHIKSGIKDVQLYGASGDDYHSTNQNQQSVPKITVLPPQASPEQRNTSRTEVSHSQIISPGAAHSYSNFNQFPYGSSIISNADSQLILQTSGFTPAYPAPTAFLTSSSQFYANLPTPSYFIPQYSIGYNFHHSLYPSRGGSPPHGGVPMVFESATLPPSGLSGGGNINGYGLLNLQNFYSQAGWSMVPPLYDAFPIQHFQQPGRDSYGEYGYYNHSAPRDGAIMSQPNAFEVKRGAEVISYSTDQKLQHSAAAGFNSVHLRRENESSKYFVSDPNNVGPFTQFHSAVPNPVLLVTPRGTNVPRRRNNSSVPQVPGGNTGKSYGMRAQSLDDTNSFSFLEELRLGRGQKFELSDIEGRIGEFSFDQHGSRFIQQKLETCTVEEKAFVFREVVVHASRLMTDVFGNYVIQKLFEYGSSEQRRDLANQLEGQILPLSLQMYGCRVIQKAFEVIDLEQKVRLAKELHGHVITCVCDQNGNHVIQKCIESIPAQSIPFIISSFRGQVASLSTHSYGCRVIQRVLEHCKDEVQMQFIAHEILESVHSLAQDQYGNYVTQHVLERGTPHIRSQIIRKISGSIVQLSQHKFASNVVEKCLVCGDSTARGMLIQEVIGDGDKKDSLLVMMKDPYANYVIQKILQICTTDQRELLLGLIRSHLTALKRYTYGKHIAAQFEQLCGEDIRTP